MFENSQLLERVEHALDEDPYCPLCGAHTTIEDEDGRLWLVCAATTAPSSVLGRVSAAILPHERRLIVDLREDLAA
ncbi:MAG: hypothetical protein QOI37_1802 [Chloroflexota bacterium]|jgi:hypothetical protein|nr:hypothetical protein [Chloroflexota bacterium]HEV7605467.1 hypothetical protein [Candidatus Limnocylindrales bacterium]